MLRSLSIFQACALSPTPVRPQHSLSNQSEPSAASPGLMASSSLVTEPAELEWFVPASRDLQLLPVCLYFVSMLGSFRRLVCRAAFFERLQQRRPLESLWVMPLSKSFLRLGHGW